MFVVGAVVVEFVVHSWWRVVGMEVSMQFAVVVVFASLFVVVAVIVAASVFVFAVVVFL